MTTPTPPTERVGRYQLLEPIGIGPSGTVSRAKVFGVAGFERQFAVKRFHSELTATAAMAAMLSAAARSYGSLEHPRIARMSEFGVAQGATFTAVEFVPGLDALRLIAEARLSGAALAAGGALALVSQAARAVGYAHGRGLTHLGLAPTNVIVTADGDVKITDFGILSATLPQRPIEAARLAQRIPYLAPEQLANEATSAATDVFALGVLAHELVTGARTFKGDTPQQVASAIMAGPPAEPPLPRPIVRVLQRCLARSPFERFPDARALADALDAALRVAPVPGTRKDIGAQVKDTLDRLAALNEGQMSGMVALHLGTGPIRKVEADAARGDAATPYEIGQPDPSHQSLSAATLSDLPRMPTTVPGLAPPPIPVPPGLGPPSIPPPPGPGVTLLGMGKTPPPALPIKARPGAAPGIPPVPPPALRPQSRPGIDTSLPLEPPPTTTTESAVHTLDPSDLLSIDALPDELDGGAREPRAESEAGVDATPLPPPAPGLDGPHETPTAPPGPAAAHEASPDEPIGEPTRPGDELPAAASADDFQDAPTNALSRSAAAAAAARSLAKGRTTYPLDPSSIDTKPIPPVTLEPLLFDPIPRSDDAGEAGAPRGPAQLDEDRWFDEPAINRAPTVPVTGGPPGSARARTPTPSGSTPGSGRITAQSASPGSGRASVPAPLDPMQGSGKIASPMAIPGSGRVSMPGALGPPPGSGRTMLGYAAPPLPGRATPSAPFPPAATLPPESGNEDELPVPALPPEQRPEPADDPLSEMVLEGFRTGPVQVPSEEPTGWPEEPSQGALEASPPAETHLPIPPPPDEPPAPPNHVTWVPTPAPPPPSVPVPTPMAGPPRRRAVWILVGMIGAVAVALGAWQLYVRVVAPPSTLGITVRADRPPPADAAQVAVASSGANSPATPGTGATPGSEPPASGSATRPGPATAAPGSAAPPAPGSAAAPASGSAAHPATGSGSAAAPSTGSAAPTAPMPSPSSTTPPGATGDLAIASTPPGARVYLDGADAGVTPLKLPGSPDRHNLALMLAGHELYITQVDGHGSFQIALKEVTPINGPAGIKVLRCKDKERYYVYVDGKPTGQTCPTERIGCELGPHTVEVYDLVSETRRKWDIDVKETRLSFRVRVE